MDVLRTETPLFLTENNNDYLPIIATAMNIEQLLETTKCFKAQDMKYLQLFLILYKDDHY